MARLEPLRPLLHLNKQVSYKELCLIWAHYLAEMIIYLYLMEQSTNMYKGLIIFVSRNPYVEKATLRIQGG